MSSKKPPNKKMIETADLSNLILLKRLCLELEIDMDIYDEKHIPNIIKWILDHQTEEQIDSKEKEFFLFLSDNFYHGVMNSVIKIENNTQLHFAKNYWVDRFIKHKISRGESVLSKKALIDGLEETESCISINSRSRYNGIRYNSCVFDTGLLDAEFNIPPDVWQTEETTT